MFRRITFKQIHYVSDPCFLSKKYEVLIDNKPCGVISSLKLNRKTGAVFCANITDDGVQFDRRDLKGALRHVGVSEDVINTLHA